MSLILSDVVVFYENGVSKGVREQIAGGIYIWETDGTFSSSTWNLQVLGADGSTYKTVASATTNAPQTVYVAAGATMKVTTSGGSPSGIYSRMSRVPR